MRSQQQNPADDRTGPARGVGAWAVYLGVSWTWCIGMFLPVLLVRDMGMAGFWVFAVPNVLGAAAMGWIIGNGQASRRITAEHSGACGAFSIVTIWFHLFFAAWFLPKLAGPAGPAVAAGAIVVFLIAGTFRSGSALTAAVVAMISAGAAVVWLYDPPAGVIPPSRLGGTWELTALADVCVFGFLLCPYLDLTFHRARQSLGVGQARAAFTLGFGVVFFGMILFSLAYARPMATVIGSPMALMAQRVRLAIMLHMALQSAFTVAEHARALVDLRGVASAGRRAMMLMGGGTVSLLIGSLAGRGGRWLGREGGELAYRCFLGFYGLVFPAYVWLCMIPGLTRRSMRVFVAAVMVALPFFAMGFVGQRMVYLIPGVFIVLLARIAVRGKGSASVE